MKRFLLGLVIGLFLALPAAAAPTLEVGEASITVSDLDPGAEVWLFGVSRYVDGYRRTLEVTSEVLVDDDGDGVVLFEPSRGVERASVWLASERSGGTTALGSRSDYPAKVSLLDAVALATSSEAVTLPRRRVEAVLIRPQGKAWSVTLGDGSAVDADGLENGQVRLLPSVLISRTDTPEKPGSFGADDVLVVIDSKTLEVLTTFPGHLESARVAGETSEEVSR